jgi:tape measure domain-containing protein
VWSDRNKASLALLAVSRNRDQGALAQLRQSALTPLAEMARWKSVGHAMPAFLILARVAGYTDEVATEFWDRGQREVVIEAAIGGRRPALGQ